jgi:hypothetical protein
VDTIAEGINVGRSGCVVYDPQDWVTSHQLLRAADPHWLRVRLAEVDAMNRWLRAEQKWLDEKAEAAA